VGCTDQTGRDIELLMENHTSTLLTVALVSVKMATQRLCAGRTNFYSPMGYFNQLTYFK